MNQVPIKYTNICHCKTLQNLPKFGFLVWKQTIWQPCSFLMRSDNLLLHRCMLKLYYFVITCIQWSEALVKKKPML
jgi:hypothetical protein